MTDEQQIRTLIERWATAVHDGDLPAVLADHAPCIPDVRRAVHGIEDYTETWPGFFEWRASGTPAEFNSDPEHRRRLTIGPAEPAGQRTRPGHRRLRSPHWGSDPHWPSITGR